MMMLRLTYGRIMVDRILNEVFRAELGVAPIMVKVREVRFWCFWHTSRRLMPAPMRIEEGEKCWGHGCREGQA